MTHENSATKGQRTKLTMVAKLILKNGDIFFRGTVTEVTTGHTVTINKGKSIDQAVREIVELKQQKNEKDKNR